MKVNDIMKEELPVFYKKYTDLIPKNIELTTCLIESREYLHNYYSKLTEDQSHYRYAQNKWTLKEILLHIIDTERIMAYRALCIARNDANELPGFDQDDYVTESNANSRSIDGLLIEYLAVRQSTLLLFESFTNTQRLRIGIANNNTISVRALGFIISGHERHHLRVANKMYFNLN